MLDTITESSRPRWSYFCLRLLKPGAVARLQGRRAPATFLLRSAVTGVPAVIGLASARTPGHSELTLTAHGRHLLQGLAAIALFYAARLLRRADPRLS